MAKNNPGSRSYRPDATADEGPSTLKRGTIMETAKIAAKIKSDRSPFKRGKSKPPTFLPGVDYSPPE
jgi:hypothetical protein